MTIADADALPDHEDLARRGQDHHNGDGIASGRIAVLEAELAIVRDGWLRSEAETANVRTWAKLDVSDAKLFAVQRFATDVVEVAENLQRGLDSLPPSGIRRSPPGSSANLSKAFPASKSLSSSPSPRGRRTEAL